MTKRPTRVLQAVWIGTVVACARHAAAVAIAALVCTIACVFYIGGHFGIDTDTSSLLSRDLPFQQRQHAIDTAFPQLRDTIVVVVRGQTPGLAEQAATRVATWARHQTRDFKSVYRPDGGRFFDTHGLLYLEPDTLQSLSDRLVSAQPLIASLAGQPTLPNFFDLLGQALDQQMTPTALTATLKQIDSVVKATDEGRFRVLNWQSVVSGAGSGPIGSAQRFVIIKPRFDYNALQPGAAAIAKMHQGLASMGLDTDAHGVKVALTGAAVLDNEQLGSAAKGALQAILLTLALIVLLLFVALRSARMVAATLVTLIVGLIWTTAFALFAVGEFNILSIAFALLFVGLSVDFGIQFCMRSREAAGEGGTPGDILERTAVGIGGALVLAGGAAAISFFSVVPTDYAGLADLGIVAGASMVVAIFANLTVLPALLALSGVYRRRAGRNKQLSYIKVPTPAARYNRGILIAATVLALVAAPAAVLVRFDFNPLSLQDAHSEAMQTLHALMRGGDFSPYSIELLEPDLKRADALARRLSSRHTVKHAVTLDSFIPKHQRKKLGIIADLTLVMTPSSLAYNQAATPPAPAAMNQAIQKLAGRLAQDKAPAARQLATTLTAFEKHHANQPAALHELQHRLFATLPLQLNKLRASLQASRVTRADLPETLKTRYVTPDGRARVQVFSRLDLTDNTNLKRFVADVGAVAPAAAGTPVLLVQGGNAVVRAFAQASITALVLIALLLWVVLRRVPDTLLALAPLPWAAIMTAATMKLVGLSFNLANVIVLPLLLGLGIAYGIYFVVRWRSGHDMAALSRSSTPSAVLFSALATTLSFGSMAIAQSVGMAMLGQTLLIALGYILVATLIVLPALLAVTRRRAG